MNNRIEKQAAIPGAGLLAGHLAQNTLGVAVAKSKKFKKGLVESFAMGAAGKKAPRSAMGYAKDAVSAVAVPERNLLRNEAYDKGAKLSGELKGMSKRQKVIARLTAAGDAKGLKRIGQSDNPLVKKVREVVPQTISKADQKKITSLPAGSRKPSSLKAGIVANAAVAPIAPDLAALNTSKLVANTKAVANSKPMKAMTEKFVTNPAKAQFKAGATKGSKFNSLANKAKAITMNPFTAEMERTSFNLGRKHF